MGKTNKLILGLCSSAVAALGVYKVLSKKEPLKYSFEWIKKLTDKEWKKEREIIRQKYCNTKHDDAAGIRFENLLMLFDKVKSDRDRAGIKPQGPAYHREYGYNLYKP